MKALLDTNIILDIWLAREPFWQPAARVLSEAETGQLSAIVSPTTVTTLHYLSRKAHGEEKTRRLLSQLLSICEVADIGKSTIEHALNSRISDFECAMLEAVATGAGAGIIITRNTRNFRNSEMDVMDPDTYLSRKK